jgi:hypothetical protein
MLKTEMTQMENHDPDDPVAVYVLEASKVEPLTKMKCRDDYLVNKRWVLESLANAAP